VEDALEVEVARLPEDVDETLLALLVLDMPLAVPDEVVVTEIAAVTTAFPLPARLSR
jgi:hypothetical protein